MSKIKNELEVVLKPLNIYVDSLIVDRDNLSGLVTIREKEIAENVLRNIDRFITDCPEIQNIEVKPILALSKHIKKEIMKVYQ